MSMLWLVGWYPNWFGVNGTSIMNLHLTIEDAADGKVLRGNADQGATALLTTADSATLAGFGTEIEALPELSRGSYARMARARGVNTLEELAALSDEDAQAIGMGWVMRRDLARDYLARSAGGNEP